MNINIKNTRCNTWKDVGNSHNYKTEVEKVLSSAVAGTSVMTLFSYAVSESKSENFREPDVLAKMLINLKPSVNKEKARFAGWTTHYATGVLFAFIFYQLWQRGTLEPNLKNALILGAASGIFGIIIWKVTFKIHPNPPSIKVTKYLGHLFLAHLVFGAFALFGYKLFRSKKSYLSM